MDQEALLAAIDAGQLAGCALDVFTPEPLNPESSLRQRPNILATPHIAGITDYTYEKIAHFIVEAHHSIQAGRLFAYCVNATEIAHKFNA